MIAKVDPLPDNKASKDISKERSVAASRLASVPSTTVILMVSVFVPLIIGNLAKTMSKDGSSNEAPPANPVLIFVTSRLNVPKSATPSVTDKSTSTGLATTVVPLT